MRRGKPFEDPGELQLTALIDIVFFLLIFFMTSSNLTRARGESGAIQLPLSRTAPPVQDGPRRLEVLVLASGDVRFAGKSLPAEALEGSLRAAAAGESGPVRVVVRADGKADFGKVREVMKACAAAGLPDVLFAAHES